MGESQGPEGALSFDYQRLGYSDADIEIGVHYNGACNIAAEVVSRSDITNGIYSRNFSANANELIVRVPKNEFLGSEPTFVRLVARAENSSFCSDVLSRRLFYRFMPDGELIVSWFSVHANIFYYRNEYTSP